MQGQIQKMQKEGPRLLQRPGLREAPCLRPISSLSSVPKKREEVRARQAPLLRIHEVREGEQMEWAQEGPAKEEGSKRQTKV